MDNNNSNDNCGLADFVNRTFKEFEQNRKDTEVKWEDNINSFKKVKDHQWKKDEGKEWRSKTFIGITKQKILAAYSIVIDTLLQGGKIPFFLKLANVSEQQLERISDEEKQIIDQDIDLMTAKIQEDLDLCNGATQLQRVVMSGAIYGESYGKKSVHAVNEKEWQQTQYEDGSSAWEQVDKIKDRPKWEAVTVWDMFRDIESDDLQKGRAVIQRAMMSPYDLRQLDGKEFIVPESIDEVIKKGDASNNNSKSDESSTSYSPARRDIINRKKSIRVLEFWGRVPRKILKTFQERISKDKKDSKEFLSAYNITNSEFDDTEENGDDIECMVLVANDEVVRYAILDEGERPYYRAVWEDVIDVNYGIGVADNICQIQDILNGAVRAFEDNKKLSANVILALKREFMKNQKESFSPGDTIELTEECDDVRKAIQSFNVADVGESLISMINLMLQFADDESNIPRIQQGSRNGGQETAFELSQRLEKSGKYLGGVIRNYDKQLIEPMITDFLEFNMLDPEAPGKGNYHVKANGFTSFQNKVTKLSAINQVMAMLMQNPDVFKKIDMDEIFREFCELLDIDPDKWMKNKEDLEAEAQMQQQLMQQKKQLEDMNMRKIEAETAMHEARAQAETAKVKIEAERLKLDMVDKINDKNKEENKEAV